MPIDEDFHRYITAVLDEIDDNKDKYPSFDSYLRMTHLVIKPEEEAAKYIINSMGKLLLANFLAGKTPQDCAREFEDLSIKGEADVTVKFQMASERRRSIIEKYGDKEDI